MPIKRGDRLVLTTKGGSEQVVALLDEIEGTVMVRRRGGVTSKRSVKDLRRDASAPTSQPAIPIPIAEEESPLPTITGICPVCREANVTTHSAGSESNPHALRVRLACANGHQWEIDSKPFAAQF